MQEPTKNLQTIRNEYRTHISDRIHPQVERTSRGRARPGLRMYLSFVFLLFYIYFLCHLFQRFRDGGEKEAPARRQGAVWLRSRFAEECRAGTGYGKMCKITAAIAIALRVPCSRINITDSTRIFRQNAYPERIRFNANTHIMPIYIFRNFQLQLKTRT